MDDNLVTKKENAWENADVVNSKRYRSKAFIVTLIILLALIAAALYLLVIR